MVVNEEVNDIQNAESWQTSISDALPLSLPPIPQKVKMDPIVKIFAGLFQRKELFIMKLRRNGIGIWNGAVSIGNRFFIGKN